MELPDNAEITLTTPLKYLPKSEKSGEVWSRVEANNGTLKKLEIKKALVKVKKKADLAEYLPQIYAFGRYEIAKDDLSLLDPEWAIGVGVKLNLFSSGEKIFKMQADNRLIQEVEEKKKEVVTLLKSLSDKLYYEADAKKNSLETYPTRLEEAEENLKLADSRFSTGLGISLEVVDAHLMLQKIQTEELQALYEYNLSWLKIHGLFQNTAEIISQWEAQK
ncbi:MAG: Outer membrane efflux protein [Candidatus Aminicenantes bacterium ADurb.Bin508]|nr:MAG: Outer membrane efflux protein [Candidatus Aminicenantes bacterium ADurb.Bin508]